MASCCMPLRAATSTDIGGLLSAGNDCKRLAEETTKLSRSVQEKGIVVVGTAEHVQKTLGSLGTSMGPTEFMAILDLINDEKLKETLAIAGQMDDMALQCADKSKEMTVVMQRGVDCFPEELKQKALEEASPEDTEGDDDLDVHDFEQDVTDLEECTKSLKNMNLLTAGSTGSRAFEGVVNKRDVFQNLFERIKELCAGVARISQTIMMESCCAMIQAGYSTLKDMLRCIRLSNLITALANAGRRLIKAFIELVKVAWEKFSFFLEEFQAAKKLKTWVNGLNPLKSKGDESMFSGGASKVAASLFGFGS